MSNIAAFVIVWSAVGLVSFELVRTGHWIAGLTVVLLLLMGTKVKG